MEWGDANNEKEDSTRYKYFRLDNVNANNNEPCVLSECNEFVFCRRQQKVELSRDMYVWVGQVGPYSNTV